MKPGIFCLLFIVYCLLFIPNVFAQTIIDGSVVPYRPNEEVTQIKPKEQSMHGLFKGDNFKIQVGFENIETESPFHISISENLIDYGQIAATDPVSRTNIVTVSGPSSQGYTLQVLQNHSLKHDSSQTFIPDTTCDNGICSESVAQAWSGILTYGFGYRCDPSASFGSAQNKSSGQDPSAGSAGSLQASSRQTLSNHCLIGFSDTSFFKSFSSETPQVVLEGISKSSAQVTFKINIPGTQAPQFYSNQIIFMAVPNF